jgi:hypothetical protein
MGKVVIYSEVLVCSIRVKLTWKSCLKIACLIQNLFETSRSLTWAMTHPTSILKLSPSNNIRSTHFSDYCSWNMTLYNLIYISDIWRSMLPSMFRRESKNFLQIYEKSTRLHGVTYHTTVLFIITLRIPDLLDPFKYFSFEFWTSPCSRPKLIPLWSVSKSHV